MGFPVPYAGVLPKLLLTAAISMAALKELCQSVLESVGLYRESDSTDVLWHFNEDVEADFHSGIRRMPASVAEAIRASLPSVLFDMLPDGNQDAQCVVCLCEFKKGQEIRQLPHCPHIFHKNCIDSWLEHDQKTCPLCRSSLVTEEVARQEKLRELQLSEELTSWFSSYQEQGAADDSFFGVIGLRTMLQQNVH